MPIWAVRSWVSAWVLWTSPGGIGAGLFKNLEEALGGLKYGAETIEPDPATMEAYQAHYEQIYTPAWRLLQPMQERLQQLYPVSLD